MELFSGFSLILAFLIFTRLAVKAKNTGSFRFQLSIFMLIWVMAEIPRVADTLGIISTAGFGLYGLTFHMISMSAFALFVGAKSYLFLRPLNTQSARKDRSAKTASAFNRRTTAVSRPGFDDLVEGSVKEAMSKMLGPKVWKAVSFYLDMKTGTREPKSFEKLMSRLFGKSSKVLQQVIGETLLSKVGSTPDRVKGREFQDWIMIAQAKFSSAANVTVPKQ